MDSEKRLREQLAKQEQVIAQLREERPSSQVFLDGQAAILSTNVTVVVAEFQSLINQMVPNDYCLLFSLAETNYLLLADSSDNIDGLLPDESRARYPALSLDKLLYVPDVRAFPSWVAEYSATWPLLRSALIQPIATDHNRYALLLGSSRPDAFEQQHVELFASFAAFASKTIAHIEERTRQELYERSLQQSEKMLSLGQLAAGVAHEINNPLSFVYSNFKSLNEYISSLRSYISGLEHTMAEPDFEVRQKTMARLKQESNLDFVLDDLGDLMAETEVGIGRVKEIVSSLKTYAQPDTGEIRPLDLREVIASAQKMVLGDLKYKAVVEYDLAPRPVWVMGNSSRLNQVFVSLIINAIQSIDHDDGKVKVKIEERKGMAVVTVYDNGSGIPQENVSRIFEPFFTTREVGEGSGLGLSVSKAIVEEHKGRLSVRSELKKGSSFRVILPVTSTKGSN
ncbi:ATP-binding protein [Salinispirillum sp. LH 10-3-1]|uniref:histidine kinase n=1 Tax=Salinispirillum sp. LH 10-3-1 TaxID=2952525 RepID=A0AB38YHH2_9GAMM